MCVCTNFSRKGSPVFGNADGEVSAVNVSEDTSHTRMKVTGLSIRTSLSGIIALERAHWNIERDLAVWLPAKLF